MPNIHMFIQDPIWLCYHFTLSADSQEILKALFLQNLGHCILVGNSKCILYVLMCNTDFQGSMKLKKIKQSYLSGMNLTDVSSVLLGKFGMQKKKLLQIPKNVH